MSWPESLQKDSDDPKDVSEFRIIHQLFKTIGPGLSFQDIVYMSGALYDEYITGVIYTQEVFTRQPLAAIQILEQEEYTRYSKEREHMELFANLKVHEHIPGMTWSEFKKLTPDMTEVVLEIAKRASAKENAAGGELKKKLDEVLK